LPETDARAALAPEFDGVVVAGEVLALELDRVVPQPCADSRRRRTFTRYALKRPPLLKTAVRPILSPTLAW
jgi:hypothetical protein